MIDLSGTDRPGVTRTVVAPILALLPDWMHGSALSVSVDRSARRLTWTFPEPGGHLFQNAYRLLWIHLTEGDLLNPMSPLDVSTDRAMPRGTWSRQPVTDKARAAIVASLVPVFTDNPGSFNRLWLALHQAHTDLDGPARGLTEAQRVVAWWERHGQLTRWWADGMLDLAPIVYPPGAEHQYHRSTEVRVPEGYRSGHWPRVTVVARVMGPGQTGPDDEQVGWLADSGVIVPTADILDTQERIR